MDTLRLNHINLCSSHVSWLSDFLVAHFGYDVSQAGKMPASEAEFAMLEGKDGSCLVITQITSSAEPAYPAEFHFGIVMDSPEEVHGKHRELTRAGHSPEEVNSFQALGASWTAFYCPVGDGMKIEVNHRMPSTAAE